MFTSFLRKVASKNNFQTSKMFAANMTGFLWNVSGDDNFLSERLFVMSTINKKRILTLINH